MILPFSSIEIRHREKLLLSNRNSATAQNEICFFEISIPNFFVFLAKNSYRTKHYRIMIYFEQFRARFSCIFHAVYGHQKLWSLFFHFDGTTSFLPVFLVILLPASCTFEAVPKLHYTEPKRNSQHILTCQLRSKIKFTYQRC